MLDLDKLLRYFLHWVKTEYNLTLYPYQVRMAKAFLESLVTGKDVYVKVSRQGGKTELLTLILRFLILHYLPLFNRVLRSAIASPHGEQAKTDIDRIKLSIQKLRERWLVQDRENNQATIRAFLGDTLVAEMFRFSLAPTTKNESKTLNLLVIEEAHNVDDRKKSEELDPMLASTGGPTWYVGVGCTRLCDFKRGCDGEFDAIRIVVDVEEVIRDRRKVFEQTGDPIHLEYEKSFQREVKKKGRQNPEIRRNYYLEDTVEAGNFISRERLLTHARLPGAVVSNKTLFAGFDWARKSDHTWAAVGNDNNDVLDWLKVPHVSYPEQVEIINEWLCQERPDIDHLTGKQRTDEHGKLLTYRYIDRIQAVRADSTGGTGDAPNEILQQKTALPMGEESFFVFSTPSKNELYLHWETLLFKEPSGFSYPSDHPLTAEFEDQTCALLREYVREGRYLSVHHPNTPDGRDDAPDSTALMTIAAKTGEVSSILFA